MNIIKKVMVFVMGVVVIGIASTTIAVVIQPKNVEKSVTFELLENDELAFRVYDKINEYAVYNEFSQVNNLVSISVDGYIETNPRIDYVINDYYQFLDGDEAYLKIYTDTNTYEIIDAIKDVGSVVTLTFSVKDDAPSKPSVVNTLLLLIPLILSASLIGYIVHKKGDEK